MSAAEFSMLVAKSPAWFLMSAAVFLTWVMTTSAWFLAKGLEKKEASAAQSPMMRGSITIPPPLAVEVDILEEARNLRLYSSAGCQRLISAIHLYLYFFLTQILITQLLLTIFVGIKNVFVIKVRSVFIALSCTASRDELRGLNQHSDTSA
jgi:hypothetical protein